MSRLDPRGRVNRALLVGVSEYDHVHPGDGVPGCLPAVARNLELLEQTLLKGGVFGEEDVVACSSPTLDDFTDELHRAARAADGLLLCYFAGHGAVPSAGDELFLQMRNARVVAGGQAVFPGADAFRGVLTVLAASHAQRIVVVLDCCYAGNAAKVWHDFAHRHRIMLLMSVQANRLTYSGDGAGPTPFTGELVRLLGADGELSAAELSAGLREGMRRAGLTTDSGDPWEPQWVAEPDTDALLTARPAGPDRLIPPPQPTIDPWPLRALRAGVRALRAAVRALRAAAGLLAALPGAARRRARAARRWFRRRSRPVRAVLIAALVLALAGAGLGGYRILGPGGGPACAPPLELRLLTDPDLETAIRGAADAYLTSGADTTGSGCRRSGITVYSSGTNGVLTALREQTEAWRNPTEDDDDPQRDIGPQPDVWIPASLADVPRAAPVDKTGQDSSFVDLSADKAPFAYSPVVLAVPRSAAPAPGDRVGLPLSRLVQGLGQGKRPMVLRADPETTDAALLATIGLYDGAGGDVRGAEHSARLNGPPAADAHDMLCPPPYAAAKGGQTAPLVPEFKLRSDVSCPGADSTPRIAEYPVDVPALTPTFVRVRWFAGEWDVGARDGAVARFHQWLTGPEGRAALGTAGFRSAAGGHPLLDPGPPAAGVLAAPATLPGAAGQAAMDTALARYRGATGPGRVLYLLDSSSSMGDHWQSASGGPALVKQSLNGLGPQDQYGVWSVYGTGGASAHTQLLGVGAHTRAEAETAVDDARLKDADADPHAALLEALDYLGRLSADEPRPTLIVYLTDDEDVDRLATGGSLDEVTERARETKIPVDMVSLVAASCDDGRPDTVVAQQSHGRCIDAGEDIGRSLHEEVARMGTGER
ncbi:caspase family protein [Streptomyces sp. NPDC046985]|uniref:caspase family protein n=1 Tax=Streptomyces sp. NPDC046985 TaxID=3155377 RepID=UPI0033D25780